MFVLEEDYYFITLKLVAILNALNCKDKLFIDYRKLSIILEFIKDSKNMELLNKNINKLKLDLFDNERLLKIFCDSNMNISIIKRVLFFLDKQNIVHLEKNNRFGCIDVNLLEYEAMSDLLKKGIMDNDILRVKDIQRSINKIRSLKFETFQTKIFGFSEVTKWEN